jgi:hypothetical protein
MKSFIAIIVTMFASQVFAADAPKAEAKKDAPKYRTKCQPNSIFAEFDKSYFYKKCFTNRV